MGEVRSLRMSSACTKPGNQLWIRYQCAVRRRTGQRLALRSAPVLTRARSTALRKHTRRSRALFLASMLLWILIAMTWADRYLGFIELPPLLEVRRPCQRSTPCFRRSTGVMPRLVFLFLPHESLIGLSVWIQHCIYGTLTLPTTGHLLTPCRIPLPQTTDTVGPGAWQSCSALHCAR